VAKKALSRGNLLADLLKFANLLKSPRKESYMFKLSFNFVLSVCPTMHHPSLATGTTMSVYRWKGDDNENHRWTKIGKHS